MKKGINKPFFYVVSFLFLHFFSPALYSQDLPIQFKHLTTSQGLSQSTVVTINQDHNNVMWFGTRDGLNKYDGNSFTVFRNDLADPKSISNNDILDIYEDSDLNMWVSTYDGLNLYDSKLMTFVRYMHDPNNSNSLSNSAVRSVVEADDGTIVVGTVDGLNFINRTTQKVTRVYNEPENPSSLSQNNIYKIFKDSKGRIWVGTERGLNKIEGNLKTGQYQFKRFVSNLQVQAFAEDMDGNVWFGTKRNGLFKLSENDGVIPFSTFGRKSILNKNIRALSADLKGYVWAGTYEGISRVDNDGNVLNLRNNPMNEGSLSKNRVKSIFTDAIGSVWVGVYHGGVNLWNNANNNFHNITALANGEGLSYNVVSSIVEDSVHIYFGTEGGGISVLNKQTNRFSNSLKWTVDLPSSNIKSLEFDIDKKQLWIGSFNAGLFVWDFNTQNIDLSVNRESGLSNNSVYDIQFTDDSHVWIGTFGGGLNLYDRNEQSTIVIRHEMSDNQSLCDDQVRTTMLDADENLWVGTQDGLSFLSRENYSERSFEFKNYFHDPETRSGEDVLVIFQDSNGTIWVGTKETGLHYLLNDNFVRVNLFENYRNSSYAIHSIIEDDQKILWVSSNNGIARFNPENFEVRLFEEADGLVSNEYNNNSSLKSTTGTYYFGGPDGVSSFIPNRIEMLDHTPSVILTDLKVYNQTILPNDTTQVLKRNISLTESINLDYNQSIFTLQFALPSYLNPDKNTYAYRLIGLDDNWKYTSVNEASFTIQQPGKYLFEVKGSNSDGVWSDELTKLTIIVRPAPWRTWWAFVLYAISIVTALYFLIRILKSRDELKHDLKLEHKENEQQKALNKMKLQFFTNVSHEFRTPLTLILGPLQKILSEYRGSNALFKQLVVIQQNANQLLKLINQLMEFRKLDSNQAELRTAKGNIVKFVKEIFLSFQPYAQSEGYEYSFTSEQSEIMIYYDRDKMERVFYNLISNAFNYTKEKKRIEVKLSLKDDKVLISVLDTGIGIKQESLNRIFDRFYQVDQSNSKETAKGTGIGLALTKGIVDLHKGQITVESELGSGSEFTVELPVGNEHLSENEIIENFRSSEDLSLYRDQTNIEDVSDLRISVPADNSEDKKTILVVEDNDHVRQFIIGLLKDVYQVRQARNGVEGLVSIDDHQPDLIISDVMMPEMDGIEFCTKIKSSLNTSHIPVILLTARTSLIFKYEGLESGADDYINKPFNTKEFLLKVKNLLAVIDKLRSKFQNNDLFSPSELTITSIDEEMLKKAISVVDENIGNAFFDVPAFYSELGVSRTVLFTKIKAWTNMTPKDFIQSMRMKRAAHLLEQGKMNVSQICFSVGYRNPKYFSRTFQKHYSMTPTAYAKKFKSYDEDLRKA